VERGFSVELLSFLLLNFSFYLSLSNLSDFYCICVCSVVFFIVLCGPLWSDSNKMNKWMNNALYSQLMAVDDVWSVARRRRFTGRMLRLRTLIMSGIAGWGCRGRGWSSWSVSCRRRSSSRRIYGVVEPLLEPISGVWWHKRQTVDLPGVRISPLYEDLCTATVLHLTW